MMLDGVLTDIVCLPDKERHVDLKRVDNFRFAPTINSLKRAVLVQESLKILNF